MRVILLIALIQILFFLHALHAHVIIVHGSFAKKERWHHPGGNFFEEIKQQAQECGMTTQNFTWSGIPLYPNVLSAAIKLADIIIKSPSSQLILIGHSYGGNVINLASQLLNPSPNGTVAYLKKALCLCSGLTKNINTYVKSENQIKKLTTSHNSKYYLPQEPSDITQKNLPKKPIFCVFLLGTPINTSLYAPCKDSIELVYNLYSHNDGIQTIGGLCKKTVKNINNFFNCAVNIGLEKGIQSPGHSDMHHPMIGRWLLHLLHLLEENNNHKESVIHFSFNDIPKIISL